MRLHRHLHESDPAAFAAVAPRIRAITGSAESTIDAALINRLPSLQLISIVGVGYAASTSPPPKPAASWSHTHPTSSTIFPRTATQFWWPRRRTGDQIAAAAFLAGCGSPASSRVECSRNLSMAIMPTAWAKLGAADWRQSIGSESTGIAGKEINDRLLAGIGVGNVLFYRVVSVEKGL